jgi:hypothetical protein
LCGGELVGNAKWPKGMVRFHRGQG